MLRDRLPAAAAGLVEVGCAGLLPGARLRPAAPRSCARGGVRGRPDMSPEAGVSHVELASFSDRSNKMINNEYSVNMEWALSDEMMGLSFSTAFSVGRCRPCGDGLSVPS